MGSRPETPRSQRHCWNTSAFPVATNSASRSSSTSSTSWIGSRGDPRVDLDVTVRIELERRARRLEHRLPAGKRPEATFTFKAEQGEAPFDLGAMRHDDVDVTRQVEARRPVRHRQPTDDNRANRDRAEGCVDDSRDLEHFLGHRGNLGGLLKLEPERFEICLLRMTGHSAASPRNRSQPFRRRPRLITGPSVAGARASISSA